MLNWPVNRAGGGATKGGEGQQNAASRNTHRRDEMRSYPRTAQSTTVRPSRSYSWTEMDEQMAREGQARINSMQSIGNARRNVTTKDSLKPGQSRVPSSGAGGGGEKLSLGQVMWATNYRNG